MKITPWIILTPIILLLSFSRLHAANPKKKAKTVSDRPAFLNQREITNLLNTYATQPKSQELTKLFKEVTSVHTGLHLAHVVSWYDISGVVDNCLTYAKDIQDFIEFLTEIDPDAKVGTESKKHEDMLGKNGRILLDLNKAIRTEATKVAKTLSQTKQSLRSFIPDKTKLKKLLNSAPANLRYGRAGPNTNIQSFLDPMGDSAIKLTDKERAVVAQTDPKYIHYGKNLPLTWTFQYNKWQKYATTFKNLANCYTDNTFRGTHYELTKTIKNNDFDPRIKNRQFIFNRLPKTKVAYVLSSSQSNSLKITSDVEKGRGEDIVYYVKYE